MESYIVINGKRVDLTEEQVKILKDDFEEKKEEIVISEPTRGDMCWQIDYRFSTRCITYYDSDRPTYESGNIYPIECEDLVIQDALHMELASRLRMFTRNHGWNENIWKNEEVKKFFITYKYDGITVFYSYSSKSTNEVYFISKEIANQAIEEIVIPFMKNHPQFVW